MLVSTFLFRCGNPVLSLTSTVYPSGKSQGIPFFSCHLVKKYKVLISPLCICISVLYRPQFSNLYAIKLPPSQFTLTCHALDKKHNVWTNQCVRHCDIFYSGIHLLIYRYNNPLIISLINHEFL